MDHQLFINMSALQDQGNKFDQARQQKWNQGRTTNSLRVQFAQF